LTTWQRTYWVVFGANLITAIGMMSFLPFFPAILEDLGVTGLEERMVWSGVLFGAAPLAAAVMGPLWGSLGDRVGRKPMLLRALLAIAVFVGAMGFATSPWQLLFLRLGQGVFSGFVPPSITLVSVSAPRELQGRVTGTLQAALPAGMVLGPLAGERIQALWGVQEIFFFVALAAATSSLLVALFAQEDSSLRLSLERFSPTAVLSSTLHDLRSVFANRPLREGLLVLATVQFAVASTNPQLQLFVEELWTGDPARVEALTAWLFTGMALAGLPATPLWGRVGDHMGHGRALTVAALGTAVVLALCGLVHAFAFLLGARILLGTMAPGVSVTSWGVAATESEQERRGGAFGAVFSVRAFALSLGSASGGVLSSLFGIRGLFLASGALVIAVWALALASKGRRGAAAAFEQR